MNKILQFYLATFFIFVLFTYFFIDINLSFLKTLYTGLYLNYRLEISVIYTILISVMFLCFYIIIGRYREVKINKLILFFIVAGVAAYPAALSFDIFNYMTTAKVTYYYLENPYVVYPFEFLHEPYLEFTRAANKTALYGPVWILLSAIPHFAGFGNFIITLFSFKIFIALFYIFTTYIISKLNRNAVLFFALNPLVLIETLISGHNDIVMIFFTLLAFYLIKNKSLSFISLVSSILIKFSTILLIPTFLFYWLKKIDRHQFINYSAIVMFIIFLLTPLREELYPWYAIWFIIFTCFLYKNKLLQYLILIFCLGLMLRYIPYMATGNYFGLTPLIRNLLTFFPLISYLVFVFINTRLKKN